MQLVLQATNAATSASAASTSETNASNSASAASTSETNAASSATAAASSATTAASFTPSQTGNSGKYLTTNGSVTSWDTVVGGGATGGGNDQIFYENDQTVTTDYTITTNKNAMTAGAITINSGVTVTVPSGSTWTIV